jgi:predicted nuclease of predicted toxin-antitoxin system
MDILLDESIPRSVEEALEDKGIEAGRYETGVDDAEVMTFAIKNEVPVITRDQGDFVMLSQELNHCGILMDKQMHLRKDTDLVADTVKHMLEEIPEEDLSNSVWYLSNFYGR